MYGHRLQSSSYVLNYENYILSKHTAKLSNVCRRVQRTNERAHSLLVDDRTRCTFLVGWAAAQRERKCVENRFVLRTDELELDQLCSVCVCVVHSILSQFAAILLTFLSSPKKKNYLKKFCCNISSSLPSSLSCCFHS